MNIETRQKQKSASILDSRHISDAIRILLRYVTRLNVSVELVPRPKRLDAVVGVTSEPLQSPVTGEEVIDHLVGPTAVQLALGADSFTAKNFQFHFEMEAKLVIVSAVGGGKDETADRADLPPTLR